MLYERNVTPGRSGESDGIVVAVARKFVAVGGQLVPLFARDLTRFAANAKRGVGEKSHFSHMFYLSSSLYEPASPRAT